MSTNTLTGFSIPYPQPSDDQLLFEAKSGDARAFAELCQRYSGVIKKRIFKIVGHREDTEDVLQETFMNAYQHLHSFRGECRFSHWITKIGINTSLMLLRKQKRVSKHISSVIVDDPQTSFLLGFQDSGPDPEQRCIRNQTHQMLSIAIQRLPPRFRAIMHLYYQRERPMSDAAEALGITEAAAKSRLLRARKMLRRLLKTPMGSDRRKKW